MRRQLLAIAVPVVGIVAVGLGRVFIMSKTDEAHNRPGSVHAQTEPMDGLQKATFGAGCFWCTEAVFQQLKGVRAVVSGYSGGQVQNPTYEQVCSGRTGHA